MGEVLEALSPLFLVFLLNFFLNTSSAHALETISHKGIHHEECFKQDYSCLSNCLNWSNHSYLENTIPAIKKAFELGADRVEIDLQFSADEEVMVYHDESLICRAGIDKYVHDLSVRELKKIDIASQLGFLNHQGNPLKGKGVGMMPTLREVLLMFPNRGFLLNPKSENPRFLQKLNETLAEFVEKRKTHQIEKFSMWGPYKTWHSLKTRFPAIGERFAHGALGRNCEQSYLALGWSGYFPPECKNIVLAFSALRIHDWNIWGGALGLLQAFHVNNSKIYIVHLKDREELLRLNSLGLDGIISGRMELMK